MLRVKHLQRAIVATRCCHHGVKGKQRVMGIRREDYGSQWERRAPFNPSQVKSIVDQGVKVLVQPSNRRAYPMQDYETAGATIQEDLNEASLIVGVKQVPIPRLLPNKTYCFFSHTIKAQKENMPMLDAILEKNIRLVDYEKIVDEQGKRIVAFGKFAGIAGMINILHGLGLRLLALGHHTPFIHIAAAHNYRNSSMARQAVRDAGYEICLGLIPKSVGPMTFVVMGAGNVSQGALEVMEELPVQYVKPEDLREVAENGDHKKVYIAVVNRKDHIINKDGSPLDPLDYDKYPEKYTSVFSEKIAPWASCIVNGIFWDVNHPRFLSNMDTKQLLSEENSPKTDASAGCPRLPHRLLAISDITADPGGSIEFITDCTSIEAPFALYGADHKHQHFKNLRFSGDGVLVCSVDNMPAQLPREATDHFGEQFTPLIPELIKSDASKPLGEENFSMTVKDAIIASNGQLTSKYEYIAELREKKDSLDLPVSFDQSGRKVFILGSGNMAAPTVEYLTRDRSTYVTVGSEINSEIEALSSKYPNTMGVYLKVGRNNDQLEKFIKEHDVVMSLLPGHLHPLVAKLCIKHKKHMVTASYVSPEMKALQQDAFDAGITIMNEVGLDPGIDHLLAMECFDAIKERGGKIISYESWCGGLPAPEFSENALKYKFNWSPLTALSSLLRDAKFLRNGKEVYVPPGRVLDPSNIRQLNFLPGFNLEGLYNRDSTKYVFAYGIPTAHTVVRGTIRYKGFSAAARTFHEIGMIDNNPHPALSDQAPELTWRELLCLLNDKNIDCPQDELNEVIFNKVGQDEARFIGIKELDLLSDQVLHKLSSPMATFAYHLGQKLSYSEGERDLVIMRHQVGVENPDKSTGMEEVSLTIYGEPYGFSAMAKSVGYPTAIAARMLLDDEIHEKGVVIPFSKSIYRPMLNRLKAEDIRPSTRTSVSEA
ncbi:alpha-aminoadipic semialdehyde synthase, mitochondrial-like isoform X2 [Apostichopus japonicus]